MNILTYLFGFLLIVCISTSQAQFFDFSKDSVLTVAQETKAALSGYFNNDQAPDLAVAIRNDQTGSHVAVFLNDGTGIFPGEPDSTYPVGHFPNSISAGDFNGDEITDLAVSLRSDSLVWLLYGAGDGTFGDADSLKVSSECLNLIVADVNNDQKQDIVVATELSQLIVYMGNGDRTFAAPDLYASSGAARSLDAFDMNNDEYVDILVGIGNTASLTLHYNDGTGDFTSKTGFHTVRPPWYVKACHLNEDATPDVIIGSGSYPFENVISLVGDTLGNYTIIDTASAANYVNHISLGDFNGDGNPDVAAGDRDGVYIIRGEAGGYFSGKDTLAFEEYYRAVATVVADFNLDGKDDLVITRERAISVFYNTTVISSVTHDNDTPASFGLFQNFPNPFNPVTTIKYQISTPGQVELSIYNVLGEKIQTLLDQKQSSGIHTVHFRSNGLATGIYFYRIKTKSGIQIRKMHILK